MDRGVVRLTLSLLLIHYCSGVNILGVLPLPLYSHTNAFMPLFRELAARGHNVTLLSPFPLQEPIKNLKHILVDNVMPQGPPNLDQITQRTVGGGWLIAFGFWYFALSLSDTALKLQPIKDLILDTDSKFDLILLETFFMQEPLIALGHKFGAPVVNLNCAEPSAWVSYITGTPYPYSYVPALFLPATDHMTFAQRLKNTLWNIMELMGARYFYLPQQEAAMKAVFKYPGSENMPPLLDMLMNTSLTLVDSHFSLGYPRPYHNNIVEIGGLTIEEKPAKIPPEIQKFMDDSPHGIVYFSTGSWLKSSDLKPELIDEFKKGFAALKQRVLWKWDGPPMDNKPENIMTAKWFPQTAILSHKKCKAFLSHGGIHSLLEAVNHGIPVVGLPLLADQPHNLKFIEDHGIGLTISLNNLTQEKITKALSTVIADPSYKKKAVERSSIVKDRPMSALDSAVYWTEYVINHRGAAHLRPAVLEVGWCRYLLLDVLALLAALLALASFILLTVCRCCCRPCRSSAKSSKKSDSLKRKTE